MTDELKSVEAGEYTLVARLIKGEYRGALWTGGKMVCQVQGGSIDEVLKKLSTNWLSIKKHACERALALSRQQRKPSSLSVASSSASLQATRQC